jgi:hypothetical protein
MKTKRRLVNKRKRNTQRKKGGENTPISDFGFGFPKTVQSPSKKGSYITIVAPGTVYATPPPVSRVHSAEGYGFYPGSGVGPTFLNPTYNTKRKTVERNTVFENPALYYDNLLHLHKEEYNFDHIMALFIKLFTSLKAKDLYKVYKDKLDSQYYRKLLTPAQYDGFKKGLEGIKDKFEAFGSDVQYNHEYKLFNTTGAQSINTLKDWVEVFELLYGFESQYKQYLASNECKTLSLEDIGKLEDYCQKLPETERCTYPNKCCPIKKSKEGFLSKLKLFTKTKK